MKFNERFISLLPIKKSNSIFTQSYEYKMGLCVCNNMYIGGDVSRRCAEAGRLARRKIVYKFVLFLLILCFLEIYVVA